MKSTNWKDIAEVIGIAAILASLVFVGYQLKQAQEIAVSEMNISLVSIGIETANLINVNADVWLKGNTGAEMTPTEKLKFHNIVDAIATRYFVEHRHAMRLGQPGQAEAMLHTWSGFLFDNPGARKAYEDRENRLIRYRETLNPDGESFSYFAEAIGADLEKLERIDGRAE